MYSIGIIIFALIIFVILLLKYYFLNKALNKLSHDIRYKINNKSNLLITHATNNATIEKLSKEINFMFDALSESQKLEKYERESFNLALHNIAHDIRTPLTIANGYLQQTIKNSPAEDMALIKIKNNLEIVSKRLTVLLEYQALLENKKIEIEVINLNTLLKNIFLQYYDRLTDKKFNVSFDFPNEEYYIYNNSEVFERIMQNILGNVLKHGKNNLSVKLTSNKNRASIIIKNETQQQIVAIEKLTNRFYSENLSSFEVSSGLGLYIVKELVEQTNGEFDIFYNSPVFVTILNWEIIKKA